MNQPSSIIWFNTDRGVSPVIGVTLLVFVTVMCAAVVGTYVVGPWG